jgi:hypothetical protein
MSKNLSQPLNVVDRLKEVAEEQSVGDHFEGESRRERKVGRSREVVVDIFKREADLSRIGKAGTFFLRVSLRSMTRPKVIMRFEIDIDRYANERDLIKQAMIGAGALAEQDNERRRAKWNPEDIARAGEDAAKELFADLNR